MYGKSEDHFPHRLLYRKSKDEILSFSFDEVQSCWFAKVSLKGGPRVIQERRLMKLSNNFRPDGEPIKVGQRLLFLGSTPGQICWLTFDLVKEEFDEILLVSRNGLLPKGRGKKSKFLVATGFKLRRNRIHGCPILSNDSVYSILTLSDDDGQGLVSVLLCRKVDADSGIIKGELKALGHCAVMASDQLPPADSKGRFVLAGTNTIWRYDGKSFNKGPLLQNPLAYLGSSVIFYRGRGYCFAFIVHNKGMDELAQAFKTVSVHLASFGEDRKVTIHEPRIAYSQIMQGENLFCARHLTLWKERYLVASMMGHCFAICLKSGAYRVIRHNDRVVSLALATNGTVAAYLDSSRIWSTQVELFLRNAKRLRLRN